ncbi:MAG: hypothetical protein QM736_01535 [Vicinamibacterales bacterium]
MMNSRDMAGTTNLEIVIDGVAAMGGTIIRVPPGWTVDMKAVAIMGRASDNHRARLPNTPANEAESVDAERERRCHATVATPRGARSGHHGLAVRDVVDPGAHWS